MLERVTHNARGAMLDVYTSYEWPTVCRAVEHVSFRDKSRDSRALGSDLVRFLRPEIVEAVGIEPSPEHLGLDDLVAIARKDVDRKTSLKPGESGLTAPLGTRVPDSDSIDAILAHARLARGAMRVI